MISLGQLARSLAGETARPDLPIAGIACHSQRVEPGFLFVAVRGFKQDGHHFLRDALDRGAAAVVIQDPDARTLLSSSVPVLVVEDSRLALAKLSCEFYGHPSKRIKLIGVTGTNGKTTTCHLIAALLRKAGLSVGVVGTLGVSDGGSTRAQDRTTPEALELQRLLAEFVAAGMDAAVIEVSSHSLSLRRAHGCLFDTAVFTNLSQDHLDFHRNLDQYFAEKAKLFTDYAEAAKDIKRFAGVVNLDDPFGRKLQESCPLPVITYGIDSQANLVGEAIEVSPRGTSFVARMDGIRTAIRLQIAGRFNVYNALAAFAVARLDDVDVALIRQGLEEVTGLPGRLQMIEKGQLFSVAVDYAHTPDGLRQVITTARELTSGKVITVFGCGGDRDRSKRPKMGAVSGAFSDFTIVTSDNPRSEDPEVILHEIVQGFDSNARFSVEVDRHQAIQQALNMARPGDFILIAGKGHEDYQIFKDCTVHFSDREVVEEILERQ